MNSKQVGATIAYLRNHLGLTQQELAARLGVTDKAVSRWECGYGTPDISLLGKLSLVLDTDIESILDGNIAHYDMNWKGIIIARYGAGLSPETVVYDKTLFELQLGLLLLAGIGDIAVIGAYEQLKAADRVLESRSSALQNVRLVALIDRLHVKNSGLQRVTVTTDFKELLQSGDGIMLIDGVDFIYGKDVTKVFRRVMYGDRGPVRLTDYHGRGTGTFFFPNSIDTRHAQISGFLNTSLRYETLERGVVTFPIDSRSSLESAATMMRAMDTQMDTRVLDIYEIVQHRKIKKLGKDLNVFDMMDSGRAACNVPQSLEFLGGGCRPLR